MPHEAVQAKASSATKGGSRYFLRSWGESKFWELPSEVRHIIFKGILLNAVVKFRHWSLRQTREFLLSKITPTREDYERFSEGQVMSKRDIDDYVEFLYHKDRETCATCPQEWILGANDCRCPAVTRLYPIPTDMLLVSKRFRQDVLVAYSLVQQMVPEVIGTAKVQPSTFRPRSERCCKPGAVKQPNPPPKGFNEFSRDLIERSLYPSSPVC
ncbi:hypothetical protein TWF788_002587 [Orbilia oligospora]|uniref:Uncharacterized protein n=1 Tax=Orbilia oligospora TaxID=2813651 RepID=A0A7C8QKN6_ORBOL|nr:hypothetical protein TWF788_002587 [Orbilia oligospora]KAF3215106.1 hypothetical protein TWF191_009399 [Orbilia oligospora]